MPCATLEARRASYRKHYQKHRVKCMEREKQKRATLRDFVRWLKAGHPCTDCGRLYQYYVMQFDHVHGEKVAVVDKVIRTSGKYKALAEILKCQIVCANCHMIRTHSDRV